jgi:uncharacterized protein (TIGR03437 family)
VLYSTTIKSAKASSIAVDRAGNTYVAGLASAGLPVTPGALPSCSSLPVCADSFLAKLSAAGRIEYVTYVPGNVNDMAVNSRGEVWTTGETPFLSAGSFSFVRKYNSAGTSLLFHIEFGGGLAYQTPTHGGGFGITVDSADAVYAVGHAQGGIPVTIGPARQSLFVYMGYLLKLEPDGKTRYLTYVHPTGSAGTAVAVDLDGNAYVGFSTGNSLRSRLAVFSPDASSILSATDLPRQIRAISLDGRGGAAVVGSFGGTGSTVVSKLDFTRPAAPEVFGILNAASGRPALSPGAIVSLYGYGFEPGPSLRVTFDDRPAPILFANPGQIDAIVPFATHAGGYSTTVKVYNGAQMVTPYMYPVVDASPGLFTATVEFERRLAALNEDGTVNSRENPASAGSVISLFLTGLGRYDLDIRDGELGPLVPPFPAPLQTIRYSITPPNVTVAYPLPLLAPEFTGQAPGLVGGVVQTNIRIPQSFSAGKVNIGIYVGSSQTDGSVAFVGPR